MTTRILAAWWTAYAVPSSLHAHLRFRPGAYAGESIIANPSRAFKDHPMAVAAAAATRPLPTYSAPAATSDTVRQFHVHFPEKALTDLRRRIAATRWPDKETVADHSQGA